MSSPLIPQKTASQTPKPRLRMNSAFKQLWSIHWWMAGCYLLLFVGGFSMVRMPEDTILQENAYTLHKSLGSLTMALLTWRIFWLQRVWWRKYTHRRPLVDGEWMRTFLLHTAIYVFMLAVPISGFFLSNSYQSGNVPFFWVATVPDLFPQNAAVVDLARDLHFWIGYTFLAFIVLHAIDQKKYMRSLWRRSNQALKKALLK
ncbi:cytochrome b [Nodosilinea sp. LEGE 07088]|uniref:cytochrome b n=1 Tax=Nodosilinea sp. LEGE 07088 TaxID=2777968 RepID=UPI0018830028|nr:cytochrome b [Nodosilinea sp. LEGE 07088]MBE9136536.1 cytochrome b [Nodosilinea sp. LEGE 07088]